MKSEYQDKKEELEDQILEQKENIDSLNRMLDQFISKSQRLSSLIL